ncbi:hypothetical protein GCM10007368_33160 [Isoptericola cucumis]|uniref:YCII-related domain-containing protein n=1 Tax=Isoptericola cucumis TaxID=1776856 RepID=A0ABQ2BAY6_9MICO|nr:hypothetical protein GCM10007368_33160 [Isoptericola cucumis]
MIRTPRVRADARSCVLGGTDAEEAEPVVTDGPFVEASEYVGGFWVIEADDEAAAVGWATRGALALRSRIEVRALQEPPEA